MSKQKLLRRLYSWHAYIGLILGIIYLIVSISGATVVYVNELTEWAYGDNLKVSPICGKAPISYDKMYALARKEYPYVQYHVVGKDTEHENRAYSLAGVKPHLHKLWSPGLQYDLAYVDPYSEKIIYRSNSYGYHDFFHWLIGLHAYLQLGDGGEFFISFLALAMLGSLITGTILYRKSFFKVLFFRAKFKWSTRKAIFANIHRIVGTWALLINILIFFSGFYLYKSYWSTAWWKNTSVNGISYHAKNAELKNPIQGVSLDSLARITQEKIPELTLQSIAVASDSTKIISLVGISSEKLFGSFDNYIMVNYKTDGTLMQIENKKWKDLSASEKWDNINWGILHTGWGLGNIGKAVWCLMGFMPSVLSLSGFIMWWNKKRKKNK